MDDNTLEKKVKELEARVDELETAWRTGKMIATDENIEKGLLFNDPKYLEEAGPEVEKFLRTTRFNLKKSLS